MNESAKNNICMVTTLSAPVHETVSFVNYHINMGVDHLLLFFDNPNDEAIKELNEYEAVTAIKCDGRYWLNNKCKRPQFIEDRQVLNSNNALSFAKEHMFEWLVHIDSDELIHCETSLKESLLKFGEEVHIVRFDMREAVPEKLRYDNVFKEVNLFKSPPTVNQLNRIKSSECKQALYRGEYFRAHLGSKSAVRVSAPMRRMHIHRAFGRNNNLIVQDTGDIILLHYDCCEYEAWKTKCTRRLDGTAPITETFVRENRKQQLSDFKNAFKEGADQLISLYKNMYFIPEDEKIFLISLGVLSNIDLNEQLFTNPC